MADRAQNILHAAVYAIGTGQHILVAAVAGYRIRVLGVFLSASAAEQVTFQDATTSLADLYLGQDAPVSIPIHEVGWLQTVGGQALTLMVQGGATVTGSLVYQLVPAHWQ